jgi:hypothetical protein
MRPHQWAGPLRQEPLLQLQVVTGRKPLHTGQATMLTQVGPIRG